MATRRAFYRYRAGHTDGMTPQYISFLQSVRLVPDPAMQRYLPSWLSRINAIPFTA